MDSKHAQHVYHPAADSAPPPAYSAPANHYAPPHSQYSAPLDVKLSGEKGYYDSSADEDEGPKGAVPTLLFHVYRDPDAPILKRRRIFVSENKRSVEYYVSCHQRGMFSNSASDVILRRGTKEGPVIGEVIIHSTSNKLEATTKPLPTHHGHERQFAIRGESLLKGKFHVDFADLGGQLCWKHTSSDLSKFSVGNLKLVEEATGKILARFYGTRHKSIKKLGRFEIYGERIHDEPWLTAVLTTGMGMVERDQRARGE